MSFVPRRHPSVWSGLAALSLIPAAGIAAVGTAGPQPPAHSEPAHTPPASQSSSPGGFSFDTASYPQQVLPTLHEYCFSCHSGANPPAGIDLSAFRDQPAVLKDLPAWKRVLTQLKMRSMPPATASQPSSEDRERLVEWTSQLLAHEEPAEPNPGRVLIHRLSRTEYNNTIRDLFGVDTHPADSFPPDGGGGGGFDNNADTLFVPPILMERYFDAAGEILDAAKPERIFFVRPGPGLSQEDAARRILRFFASRAYRRPATTPQLDRLMVLYMASMHRGAAFEPSVKLALKAVLVSPEFLFRVEKDQGPGAHRLDDYELASRLSYFLWASMPDEELLELAGQGKLHDPAVLDREISRMLQSPKSRDFADSFTGQWLRTRDLYTTALPDPDHFPQFTPVVRDAMYNETVDFFDDVLRRNQSLLNLVDSDYTYLNQPLAQYYGIKGVTGAAMQRVSLADHRRGGVLTMGSVLTVTSYPLRTSPVLRGKWVLESLLGTVIPPPPPNAGGLPVSDAPEKGLTFRQRLEKHRERPECASCHSKMDPLGFGLENFDATGRWRADIGGTPVDASGVLVNGEKFNGPVELKQHLLEQKDEVVRNLAQKMLSYALGRGLDSYDDPAVDKIVDTVKRENYRSDALVRAIVQSYPFQYREG